MIEAIEDALLAHLAQGFAALPYRIVETGSYAGELDEGLDQVIRRMPAVWVAFAGAARPEPLDLETWRVPATFAVMHGARNPRGERYTRHSLEIGGQIAEVGVYRMLDDVGELLRNQTLGLAIAPLAPGRITTLYNTRLGNAALAVFAQEWHTAWEMPVQP